MNAPFRIAAARLVDLVIIFYFFFVWPSLNFSILGVISGLSRMYSRKFSARLRGKMAFTASNRGTVLAEAMEAGRGRADEVKRRLMERK